jgi:hypothetical protein
VPHTRIEELGDAECRALLAGRLRIRIPDELPFTWWG